MLNIPASILYLLSSGVNELFGLAGGPTKDAELDNLKIFRINHDSTQTIIQFDYNDLMWSDNSRLSKPIKIPMLKAGDILLVPGEPRFFLKDYLSLGLSVISTIASIATLFVYLYKK